MFFPWGCCYVKKVGGKSQTRTGIKIPKYETKRKSLKDPENGSWSEEVNMKTQSTRIAEEMTSAPWSAQPWLGGTTVSVLTELNEQSLGLMADEAALQGRDSPHPLLRDLLPLWRRLDAAALKRAAECPYLLVDTGFGDPSRWLWAQGQEVLERPKGAANQFFTLARAPLLMRTVLTYGWHLAQNRQSAARLLLAMSAQCASLMRGYSLTQVAEVAERHPAWLQPRWPLRVRIWREFLTAALEGDGAPLQQARLRGLQILAADARALPPG
jgi:hypothetical protein